MKLILAQYLRTLKERDEFDRLLPDLLLAMNYIPVSKPQTGVRQYGVDLAAVGISPEDGIQELLLLVIKRGDIGRGDWDTGPQSVRQSLNEVFDIYLKTLVEPSHQDFRKKVVLATTGDLKQDTQINWDGYTKEHSAQAAFSFWGGDRLASLIEQYMLDEHLFTAEDRTHLRKSLALAGELEYDQKDLYRLFHRQLELTDEGELLTPSKSPNDLVKAFRVVNLSTRVFSRWSEDEANLKQALLATERAMLWSWHRIHLDPSADKKRYYLEFAELWRSYNAITHRYFENLQDHLYIPDGLSGYCRENAEFALVVFEQIGLLASIGLSEALASTDDATSQIHRENAVAIADALAALLRNNPVSGSPRMDEHVIDIVLGLLLLVSTGYTSQALNWLTELVRRADYTFKRKRNFPISTDSTDDLIEATVFGDEELRDRLIKTSWLLPTLAAWSVILKREDLYAVIAKNSKTDYPQVCLQLWHPNQDLFKYVYYQPAHHSCGESEAPIILPDTADEYRSRMVGVLESARHNIISCSPAVTAGIAAIDLIACRHFRTPVPPSIWYQLLHITKVQEPDAGSPP